MRYMLLIYEDRSTRPTNSDEKITTEYVAFAQAITDSKEMVAGDPLRGVDTATSVRIRGGKPAVRDGPFAETKEHLGGYFIVDVSDLDRAIELASRIPAARTGVVEIRPIWEAIGERTHRPV